MKVAYVAIHIDNYDKNFKVCTVRGLKNYTVCSSIFEEFSRTIDRELKEIANKLGKC